MPFGFLKRGKSSAAGAPGPSPADRAAGGRRGIPFDGQTEEWHLVGRMEIEGRLSTCSIVARQSRSRMCCGPRSTARRSSTPAPGLERVDPFDLIVVLAGEGSLPWLTEADRAAHRLHKVAYDVALEVPPYHVVGIVYLFPGSEPERLLDRSTELFIPVTDAMLLLEERPIGGTGSDWCW